MTKIKINSIAFLIALIVLPNVLLAQENAQSQNSYFSNALFSILFVIIVLLLILIAVIGNVLSNVSKSEYIKSKLEKKRTDALNAIKKTLVIVILMLSSFVSTAQESTAVVIVEKYDWKVGGLEMSTFAFLLFVIVFEISLLAVMLNVLKSILKSENEEVKRVKAKSSKKTILDVLNDTVDIEHERDILLDHDYDGIKELDNNLPPWWKYGFYLTIIVAFIYMIHYHVSKTGDLQNAEYSKSVAIAKAEVAEFMKNSANNLDESTVKMMEGADLESGKEIYKANCAACHGKLGEGTVGPNLTDNSWLHSGGLVDVFKSVKYGWVDKGMKAWKEDLSPIQISQVTSYIKSIQGSNPPGAKAPQGEVYIEMGVAPTDSSAVVIDSLAINSAVAVDSLKK